MDMQTLLERKLNEGVASGAFPAGAAAVGAREGALAMAWAGRICLPDGPEADQRTRYDLASLTKVLAPTMLALRAIEEGVLTLDDTVGRFFDAPGDKREITVRQLMTHTGGFVATFDLKRDTFDPAEAGEAILRHPLKSAPGSGPRYSCMGYILLGRILERLYGDALDRLARERVFFPLGMARTGYLPDGGNIASTEVDLKTGEALTGIVHDENARFLGGVSGNAGVFSDIGDMARFAGMLARGGDGFLSPAAHAAAIRNRTQGFDDHRGLGFQIGGTEGCFLGDLLPPDSYGHTGFTGTSLAVDPHTGFYVVLLTNRVHPSRENTAILRFRRALHNALYAEYTGKGRV